MGREPGGIARLLTFVREHGAVLEYDLLRLGLDLRLVGTRALSWRRLGVLVPLLAADESTALGRKLLGTEWTLWHSTLQTNALTRRLIHAVEISNWQRGNDPKDKDPYATYPDWILMPGEEQPPKPGQDRQRFGTARKSIEAMKEWLGW